MKKKLMLGGQAVVEGVLMKTSSHYSVAVRLPSKKIFVKRFKFISWTKKKGLGWPFIRGIVVLIETLISGVKALTFSAEKSSGEKETESNWVLAGTFLFSLFFAIALFKFLPLWMAGQVQKSMGVGHFIFTLTDGVFKLIIFLVYLGVISHMKDVQRLFQYHGAEHMAVHCYEHKKALIVSNVKRFPPEHPRCGTAFILLVFFISILVYMFIPDTVSFWNKLAWRVLLLPVIAGVSYEVLRLGGKHGQEKRWCWLTAPGLWLQKLTTKKPDTKQMEVAIKALKSVLR